MLQFGGHQFPSDGAVNLGQITAADPYFDRAGFLSFAQGAYVQIHQATASGDLDSIHNLVNEPMWQELHASKVAPIWATPIQSLEQAAITSVGHDGVHDTVTVRIGSRSTAKRHHDLVEDWTFQRRAADWAGAASAPAVTQCPSCGAPVSTDEDGSCRYCHVPITGVVGDWRLISATVPKVEKSPRRTGGSRSNGLSNNPVFILLLVVVLPLVILGVVGYHVWSTDPGFRDDLGARPPRSTTSTTPTTSVTSVTSVTSATPDRGTLDGTLTLTGGLRANISPDELSTPGGDTGPCATRSAGVTGLNFTSSVENDDAGLQQDVVATVALPNGSTGPGTYQSANVSVVLHETALPGAHDVEPDDNTWTSAAGSTATVTVSGDDSGSVSFSGLVPSDPKWKPLAGSLTFTCT